MNNQELKVVWKLSKILFITAFLVWFLETSIFILIEGWHLRATNPIEIMLDDAVGNVFKTALFTTLYACISAFINLVRSSD